MQSIRTYAPFRNLHIAALCCVLLWASSCSMPQVSPTSTPTATVTATTAILAPLATPQPRSSVVPSSIPVLSQKTEIMSGIQKTLNLHALAYNHNKLDLLQKTIDQTNLPFRRFMQSQFTTYQQSVTAGNGWLSYKVTSIEERDFGFVLATIDSNGWITKWFFRNINGSWVLSEPTVKQIGEPVKIEHEHFTYVTYAWADDVNETIINLMEKARSLASERMGATPEQKATVTIRPIYGLRPYDNPFYFAYYTPSRSSRGPDTIDIFTPMSYHFGFYDPAEGWEEMLQPVLVHEYAHMIHKRNFDLAGYDSSWMSEGLAEYIA